MLSDYRPIICTNIMFINYQIVDRAKFLLFVLLKKISGREAYLQVWRFIAKTIKQTNTKAPKTTNNQNSVIVYWYIHTYKFVSISFIHLMFCFCRTRVYINIYILNVYMYIKEISVVFFFFFYVYIMKKNFKLLL